MVYMTNWYKLPNKTALCLILIIMRSSNVIKMTAGKLINLSIATFGDVRNTCILLNNVINEKFLVILITNYTLLRV